MEILTIVLFALGGFVAAIGGIMLLVAAFRQSLGWGLASLLLPFASLLFVVVHWAEAKRGFLLSLLGSAVAVGSIFLSPTVRAGFTQGIPAVLAAANGKPSQGDQPGPNEDIEGQIQQKRDQIELGEAQFRTDSAELTQEFQALQAKRAALKTGDNAAIAAFNAEAAAYQAKTKTLREWRKKIDERQLELTDLLDKKARQQSGATAPASADKKVVMYTISRCPACKAAKDYMARRGVRYEEKDVETSRAAREEFDRLGGKGVPLILVGNERMEGFSSQRLDKLL